MKVGRSAVLTASSWFGLGYLPKAPGTWGTLGVLPLWWLLSAQPHWQFVSFTVLFACFAIWASGRAEKIYGAHDVQKIVVDEVAGLLVAAIGIP